MMQPNIILDQQQQAEMKRLQEDKLRKVGYEFRKMKEELMRQFSIVEIAILKIDPVTGILPDAVIVPHTWAEGETYLPPDPSEPVAPKPQTDTTHKPEEKKPEVKEKKEIKNHGKEAKKTK